MNPEIGSTVFDCATNPNVYSVPPGSNSGSQCVYIDKSYKKKEDMKLFKVKYSGEFSYAIVYVACEKLALIPLIEKETGFELESIEVVKGRLTIVGEV